MLQTFSRFDRRIWIAAVVVILLVAAPVAWYLGSPLFIDRTVDEAFPQPSDPITAEDDAMVEKPAANAMADDVIDDGASDASMSGDATVDGPLTEKPADQSIEPMALRTGAFVGIDAIHNGVGKATIYTLPDGQRVLRFEDFEVTNGPDLYVYLAGHAAPRDSADLHEIGAFEVGVLKGNVGNQNYVLPSDLDLGAYQSVVIYCKQFSVVFSTAELSAA